MIFRLSVDLSSQHSLSEKMSDTEKVKFNLS